MFSNTFDVSKSYNFEPTGGEIILNAFDRVQVRPTEITQSHMHRAVMELNLLLARMNNLTPNLWTVDLQSLPITQGVATYSVPAETIMILDMFLRYGSPSIDRIMSPISRTEYAAISNKTSQGTPNQFWFDRLIAPTISVYLTPDGNGPYTLYYYRCRQIQDGTIANGKNIEVPPRWLDALVAGLAHRLARIYAPQLEATRKMDADEAWQIAATQDTENVPIMIAPGLAGYYR